MIRNYYCKIYNLFQRKIAKNILLSLGAKGISLFVSFASVPIMIDFLGKDSYGLWLTIFSVISWMSFFDLGLGNGLRNYLTQTFSKNNIVKAKKYISTAYLSLGIVVITVLVIFQIIFLFIDWKSFFNLKVNIDESLVNVMSICLWGGGLLLIFKLVVSVLQSKKQTGIGNLLVSVGSLLALIMLIIISNINIEDRLSRIAYVFSWSTPIVLLMYSIYYFGYKRSNIRPSILMFDKSLLKDIFGLGIDFFLAQLLVLILNQSSNFIITQLLEPADVIVYYIPMRLFSVITIVMGMVSVNLLPYFTEANTCKDSQKMKMIINKFIKFYCFILFLSLLLFVFSDSIISLWTDNEVVVPKSLVFLNLLLVSITGVNTIFATLYNGIGKIRVQLPFLLLSVIIFLTLSFFLGKNYGLNGIAIARICSQLPMTLFLVIGTYKSKILSN